MTVFCVEVLPKTTKRSPFSDSVLVARLHEAGLSGVERAHGARLFFLEGEFDRRAVERVAHDLLTDRVTESVTILSGDERHQPDPSAVEFEIHLRPGVMDPVAESTLAELRAAGLPVESVRTAWRYVLYGHLTQAETLDVARRALANDCIETVVPGTAGVQPAPKPPVFKFELRSVPLLALDDAGLEQLSRTGHLFLSLAEMRAIQRHFRAVGRNPTDLELETLAQTWSEHCVHKTLKSAMVYRGAPMPDPADSAAASRPTTVELRYGNLLKDTIVRATDELRAERRGPDCLSVFKDNAGVIVFDDHFGIAFKVETHNHPSAIEPYGGAATGVGGCIRDVLGCGLGARPIANTDVFCVAPSDWPAERLPKGVLHPRRVLRGVVKGVADYGNRMGIPTVNGAVYFDPRYLGNPLVYCGCVGLIPRDKIDKAARPGDRIVLIGGRTGRDGIHGATFSSAELTDAHADEFSHAVQIGNAITEKRILDALLQARDDNAGCLYHAVTDCGAGGLSSAVGEMGAQVGATVDLEEVPLKYAGLRYDEIWISEAQERMVLAVPPGNLARLLEIMRAEEVEATVIGAFGTYADDDAASQAPRLLVRYEGHVVGDLDMHFLHHGLPMSAREAVWQPYVNAGSDDTRATPPRDPLTNLLRQLSRPNAAAKEWIIRQYDHEVQGGSVVKPLTGPGQGPSDAAVLRPRLDSYRGVAVGCGLAPHLSDVDPYWMAAASIDEALRNVVCVGGDPRQTALLDNFCWGRTDDPAQLGALVRACQACYDVAKAYGLPFISGKDSLNNEFALDEADVKSLLATLRELSDRDDPDADHLCRILPSIGARIRRQRRLTIPGTLLISALSIVPDVRRCVTPDLKAPGDALLLIGGLDPIGYSLSTAARVHLAVADAISAGWVAACHDSSDGGWLAAIAEMALAAGRGANVLEGALTAAPPFAERAAGYVVEVRDLGVAREHFAARNVPWSAVGSVSADDTSALGDRSVRVAALRGAWASQAR